MKLIISGSNINVSLANAKGELIYTYAAQELNTELDVAMLMKAINEIQQKAFSATEPTSPET